MKYRWQNKLQAKGRFHVNCFLLSFQLNLLLIFTVSRFAGIKQALIIWGENKEAIFDVLTECNFYNLIGQ